MNKSLQKSEKLNVLTQKDFDRLQQCSSSGTAQKTKPIKNSKYKKIHGKKQEFNLLNFVTEKPKKSQSQWKHRKARKCIIGSFIVKPVRKKGKIRENSKKRHSRLKKAILRYREEKKKDLDLDIVKLSEDLKNLTIPKTPTTTTVHSRKFRSYCDNCTTPVLGELTDKLLRDLDRFQKRAHQQNEIKAHAKRRFVVGFRECLNFLQIKKAKLVIIAPDCEECIGDGGLDETITRIKTQCVENNVPYLFSLQRRQLAYALFKKVPLSCICVLDYDGANETFVQLCLALKDARAQYDNLIKKSDMDLDAC